MHTSTCTQISVKNRQYSSIQEWIEAEIADQRKERTRLEREALLRSKKLGLLSRYSAVAFGLPLGGVDGGVVAIVSIC